MTNRLFYLATVLAIASSNGSAAQNRYAITNIVASDASYTPDLVDPTLVDAWGIAIRPPANGLGGHFWVSSYANGTSNQYVGDVGGTPIFQDALRNMDAPPYTPGYLPPSPSGPATFIPDGLGVARMTGQTWQQTSGFVTTLPHANGVITGPAKFLFATEDGVISAWTDNKQPDGTPNWVGYSVPVIDRASAGSRFYGITVSNGSGLLFSADLGAQPGIKVFNPDYTEHSGLTDGFNPFAGADGFQPSEYAPFNIQTEQINGDGNLFVTYQKTLVDPGDSTAILGGLGEVGAGLGKLAEFSPSGELIGVWDDHGLLNSPYGIAVAPASFGFAENTLLVANAGDGTIVAFDRFTKSAIDYLRDMDGEAIKIDGLKGLVFGNGKSLGEADRLYFTAGPGGGAYGLLGSIRYAPVPEPTTLALFVSGALTVWLLKRGRSWRIPE